MAIHILFRKISSPQNNNKNRAGELAEWLKWQNTCLASRKPQYHQYK
jgi:hypothetical protein